WLLHILERKEVDALLIAGDIFDSANPRASAQKLWYGFLAQAVKRFRNLDIVVIGGNHDSAARLDARDPILSEFGVRVIGGVSPSGVKRKNEEYLISLTDREGNVKACACAVPFLRPPDLPKPEEPKSGSEDLLIEGTREFYRNILDAARKTYDKHTAMIAMGHLYMTGTKLSELSERKILGGNQ
ncbi:MAG: exonuclease subunit SbcD, partial [bacterium]|nr:exonuclease subunit SbcD [bacterium]